jgi:hypothetical protein
MHLKKAFSSIFLIGLLFFSNEPSQATDRNFSIDGQVALASLISLGDGHLEKMAASLKTLALSSEAKSAQWGEIEGPLSKISEWTVSALLWFALPDGSYWNLEEGRAVGNLAHRDYFPKVLQGETVIGDLVISTATQKSVAIVAVPVTVEGEVVGVLGSSIYLDEMSVLLKEEMALNEGTIFYSFNSDPLLALVWDGDLIFENPTKLSPEVAEAFEQMLKKEKGSVSYSFRGKERAVFFQRSDLTGWWYAFGEVQTG